MLKKILFASTFLICGQAFGQSSLGVTISNLPNASTPLTGSELVPMVQSGVTVKSTIASISSGLTLPLSQANGGTGKSSIAAAIIAGSAASTPLSGSELLLGTQVGAQKKITTASVAALALSSANTTVNVATYGAVGNASPTLDTTAFTNAITAACARSTATGGIPEVDVPIPPVAYTITTPLSLCKNLHIHGLGGYSTIVYTGTGTLGTPTSLFVNAGKQSVEIDHLDLEGSNNGYVYAYRAVANATSAINVRIHDNIALAGWGNGTSGGLFSIESDSGANAFYNNYVSAKTAVFSITAPTDRLDIYNNLLASVQGTCIVGASASGGAATIRVDHNIFECEGGGAISLNTLGEWIITDNEEETLTAITNSDSAIYDFNNVTLMQFDRNTSNSHGFANYDVFVNNVITNSVYSNTTGVSAVLSVFKIGTGLGNIYLYNNSGNGPSHVYNQDFAGIVTNQLYGGKGFGFGCGTTTTGIIPFTVCNPIGQISVGTGTTANAKFLTPALGAGNEAAIEVGQDFSAGNATEVAIKWYGNNDSANRAFFGLSTGQPLSVDINGNLTTAGHAAWTGYMDASAFKVGGTAGVSCLGAPTAGFTVINGIVTAC